MLQGLFPLDAHSLRAGLEGLAMLPRWKGLFLLTDRCVYALAESKDQRRFPVIVPLSEVNQVRAIRNGDNIVLALEGLVDTKLVVELNERIERIDLLLDLLS